MNEPWMLSLSGLVGLGLGAAFFCGLWWTVRKGMSSARPALWFLGSWLLRTGLVLAGFYWVGATHWPRLLSCLLGFTLARPLAARVTRALCESRISKPPQASHAP